MRRPLNHNPGGDPVVTEPWRVVVSPGAALPDPNELEWALGARDQLERRSVHARAQLGGHASQDAPSRALCRLLSASGYLSSDH